MPLEIAMLPSCAIRENVCFIVLLEAEKAASLLK